MSSSSSSFKEQKREVLAKIELMIQDTDDKGIQKVLSFLKVIKSNPFLAQMDLQNYH